MTSVNRCKRRILWFPETTTARTSRAAVPPPKNARKRSARDLFLFFRLLLGRGQPFQALEQLLLGHAIDRDLGIVGIDAAAGGADERRRLGLRLVDLDVFLQRMDE